jgi:hypothetical protein
VGRLLLDGAFIYRPFADALRIGERKGEKVTNSRITLNFKLETLGIIREILKSPKSVIQNPTASSPNLKRTASNSSEIP